MMKIYYMGFLIHFPALNHKILTGIYERCGFQQLSKQSSDALLTYVISLDKLH